MSLILKKKKCSICGKYFNWNPDVGKLFCPHCGRPYINIEKKK